MSETKIMVLKVDLDCDRCYRKVKKLLYKIHGIVEQAFDEKRNEVVIRVKSSCSETIKAKLICKGGQIIKSIEIKLDEEPKPKTEDTTKPKDDGKAKDGDKKKEGEQKKKEEGKQKEQEEKKDGKQKEEQKKVETNPDATEPPSNDQGARGYPQCPGWPYGGPCNRGCAHPSYYHGYMKLLPSNDGCSGSGFCCNKGGQAGCCSRQSSDCCCPNRCYGCRCEFFTDESSSCKLM